MANPSTTTRRRRLNLKILIGGVLLLGVLAGLVGGLWWFAVHRNPGRYADRGDAAAARGAYKEAITLYGRALGLTRHPKDRVPLLLKTADCFGRMKVDKVVDAYFCFSNITSLLEQVSELDPNQEDASRRLLEYYYEMAKDAGTNDAWDKLLAAAEARLKRAPDDAKALKFGAIARLVWMVRAPMDDKVRQGAKAELERALTANRDDHELVFFNGFWYLNEARTQSNLGDREKADAMLEAARRLVADFAERNPGNLHAQLAQVRIWMEAANQKDDAARKTQALELAAALEKQLQTTDDPEVTRELAAFLRAADREVVTRPDGKTSLRGVERCMALLRLVLERHPDNLEALFELGTLARLLGDTATAEDCFARATAERPAVIGPNAVKERNIQLISEYELITTLLNRRDPATAEPGEREELLRKAKEKFAAFKESARNSPAVEYLEGKMAYEEGNLWQAVFLLDRANSKLERKNPDALLLAGQILSSLGENGAALKRLQSVFTEAEAPGDVRIKAAKELAQVLIRLRRFGDANVVMQSLLKAQPKDVEIQLMMHRLLVEQGRMAAAARMGDAATFFQEAANILKPQMDAGNPDAQRALAEMFMMVGQRGEARKALLAYTARRPGDLQAQRNLIGLERALGQDDVAARRIEGLIAGRPDNPALVLLRQAVAQRDACWAHAEDLFAAAVMPDDFQRDLALAGLFLRMGRQAEADAAFGRAQAARPDDRAVLALRLDRALRTGAWDEASAVLEAAKSSQLEPADLKLWEGQLALARGQHAEAVAALSLVVAYRPLFSEAWALLGTAHRLLGDLGAAGSDFQKALEAKPDNLAALRGMFLLSDAWQQHAKALDYLRQSILADPQNDEIFALYLSYLGAYGDKEEALRLRRSVAELQPQNQDNLRELARLLLQQNRAGEAEKILEGVLAKDPRNRANVLAMAGLLAATKRVDQGRTLLENHVKGLGDKAQIEDWIALTRFLRQAGAADAAREAYAKAVALEDPKTMPASLELADWLQQRGQDEEALKIYRDVRAKTAAPQLWGAIVELLVRQNRLEEAEKELAAWKQAVAWDSQRAVHEATFLMRRGKNREAYDLLNEAVRRDPKNPGLYLFRAQLRAGETSEDAAAVAKADLEQALQLNPALLRARELLVDWFAVRNRDEEALAELDRLIEQRADHPEYRVQKAQILLRRDQRGALERFLNECMEAIPGLPVWHQLRAGLRRAEGRGDEAVQELGKAYELNPGPGTAMVYADSLLSSGKAPQALALLEKWPELVEKDPVARAVRGRALAMAEKGFSATEEFQKAFDLAADDFPRADEVATQMLKVSSPADLLKLLAERQQKAKSDVTELIMAKLQLAEGQREPALAALEGLRARLAQEHALMPTVLWYLGTAYYQGKEYLKARGAYEGLLKLQPNHAGALNNLSYLLAEDMQKPAEALPLAEKAASLWQSTDTERANVLDTLGRIQFLAGKLNEAEDTLQRSLRVRELPIARLHLAEVMAGRNRFADARNELTRARQLAENAKDDSVLARIAVVQEQISQKASGATPRPQAPRK